MTSIEEFRLQSDLPAGLVRDLTVGLEQWFDPARTSCYLVGSAFHREWVPEWSDVDFLLFFAKGAYTAEALRTLRPLVSGLADQHDVPVWVDVYDGLDLLPQSHYFGLVDDVGRVFGTPLSELFDLVSLCLDIRAEARRKLDAIVHDFRRRYTGITHANPTIASTHVHTHADAERVLTAKCVDSVLMMVKFVAVLHSGRVFFEKRRAMNVYLRSEDADPRVARFLEIRDRWGHETAADRAWAIREAPEVIEHLHARWRHSVQEMMEDS